MFLMGRGFVASSLLSFRQLANAGVATSQSFHTIVFDHRDDDRRAKRRCNTVADPLTEAYLHTPTPLRPSLWPEKLLAPVAQQAIWAPVM